VRGPEAEKERFSPIRERNSPFRSSDEEPRLYERKTTARRLHYLETR